MKARISLFLHFGALLVAALAAWIVFASPEVEESRGKVVLDAKPADLTRLELATARKTVTVAPRQGGGFTLVINEILHKPAPTKKKTVQPDGGMSSAAAPDAGTPPTGAPDGGSTGDGGDSFKPPVPVGKPPRLPMITENKETSYRASFELERQLERLLPLYAERDLGRPDADKLAAFGLNDSKRSLTIEVGDQKASYLIGKQTYGGATNYVRLMPDGPVYLISASALRGIDIRAPRYLERRLVELKRKDCDALDVVDPASGHRRKLQRHKLEHRDRWAPADEPDTTDSLFGTWVGKLFRLGAQKYLDGDPQPMPPVLAKVSFIRKGRATDELVLAGGQKNKQGKKSYFARSAYTGQWVELQPRQAGELADDLANILKRD